MSAIRCITALGIALPALAAAASAGAATPKERVATVERRLAAGDTMGAYVEARRLTADLAGKVALARLDHIDKNTDAPRDGDYQRSRDFRDLLLVTRDAWPALSAEWDKMPGPATGRRGQDKKALLILCWDSASEDRALDRLAKYAVKEKCILGAMNVESLVVESLPVGCPRMLALMSDDELDAYFAQLAAWWKKRWPAWVGRMNRREELAKLLAERK